jgi:glutamine---fructose-6-phosphate transaminase (isomerizing)
MCGIIAYTGERVALPLLITGLSKLEYRGYDSAGVYTPEDGLLRSTDGVQSLAALAPNAPSGTFGIAHTRWATHGAPAVRNAHPHAAQNNILHLVHNGIIENYQDLKDELSALGHTFASDTDSEVLAHYIATAYEAGLTTTEALASTLSKVRGTYGIALVFADDPGTLYAAALGSPIVIGIGEHEAWVASDATALIHETKRVVYLEDGEYAIVTPETYTIKTLGHIDKTRTPQTVTQNAEELSKQGYAHYMLKEMHEIPTVIADTTRGRLSEMRSTVKLGGLEEVRRELERMERLMVVGCGSAYYAGLYGKYLIESLVGLPVDLELGSEARYRSIPASRSSVLLAVTQSGETADTLASVKAFKEQGGLTLGLVNVVGSTIARTVDAGVYTHAGPEIGVASTKAFVTQLVGFGLIALKLAELRGVTSTELLAFKDALLSLPTLATEVLARSERVEAVAQHYAKYAHMLYIGRSLSAPMAYEGALKLKEVSYIHAEGYPAGEMKHGPLAMIDEAFPTMAIAPRDSVYEKMISNIQEIKARKGPIIMVATDGDHRAEEMADHVIWIPKAHEALMPVLATMALQQFAYAVALAKGINPDRPRNLAKSVTVE